MKTICFIASLYAVPAFFCPSGIVSADCHYGNIPMAHADKFSTSMPRSLVIPRDTPIGSTLFESAFFTHSSSNYSIICSGGNTWGAINNLGTTPAGSKLHPIDNSGLSFQLLYDGVPIKEASQISLPDKTYTMENRTIQLRIIKTGDTISGAIIPAGEISGLKMGNLKVSTINLSNSVTLTAPACQTANVNVHMGQHRLSDFPKDGAPSNKTIPFNIEIYNCPAGINKVMYSLVPTPSSPSLNDNQGIIKLNPGSTAMGVGLQVTDDSMVPVPLNISIPFKEYSSAGGNFTIPLNARYFKIAGGSGITPGTANTEMTFVMSYL